MTSQVSISFYYLYIFLESHFYSKILLPFNVCRFGFILIFLLNVVLNFSFT